MPIPTADVVAPADRYRNTVTIPVERSVLNSVAAIDMSSSQNPCDAWIEIGIMAGGKTPQHKVVTLAAEYTGKSTPVSWTGKIITEAGMFLYLDVYSTSGGTFRLMAVVTPYKVTPEGALILDP